MRQASVRDVDLLDIKTGKALRFTLVLPIEDGDVVAIEGCLARRNKEGRVVVSMPAFKRGAHSYHTPIHLPISITHSLEELLEEHYGKKLYYKSLRRSTNKGGRPKKVRYSPEVSRDYENTSDDLPWA